MDKQFHSTLYNECNPLSMMELKLIRDSKRGRCALNRVVISSIVRYMFNIPDSKVQGANMGPTWVLPASDGPHVGPMNLAIRDVTSGFVWASQNSVNPLTLTFRTAYSSRRNRRADMGCGRAWGTNHYTDVTGCLKSPTTRLFVRQLVHVNNQEHTGHFVGD